MDPKGTAKQQSPPVCRESTDPQLDIWEPPFERWQRLTEALIGKAGSIPRHSDSCASNPMKVSSLFSFRENLSDKPSPCRRELLP
jgi:hypothetical protein